MKTAGDMSGWWVFKTYEPTNTQHSNYYYACAECNELNGGDDK